MSRTNTYIPILITSACVAAYLFMRKRESNTVSLIYDADMRTNLNLPRGYRNNNPLNIRYSANSWKGKVPYSENTDANKTFEQFVDMAYGYRAALRLMRNYITKYNCDTVAKIINRWAPENENNTKAYIEHVCQFADLLPDMHVGKNDRDTLTKMAYAMSIVENGRNAATNEAGLPDMNIINEAWNIL